MRTSIRVLLAFVLVIAFTARARAGLYGDQGKDVTKGDLNDQDYWWTKFDMMMLDKAIEQKQPEGKIGLQLVATKRRLEDLQKKYPKHEQLKAWAKKVDEVNKAIDPDASRSASWKPGCPWEESNFAQAWVNYGWGKMQIADKQIDEAKGTFSNVKQNFDILLKPDRLKDYPDDLKKWVQDTKEDVDKTVEDLKKR